MAITSTTVPERLVLGRTNIRDHNRVRVNVHTFTMDDRDQDQLPKLIRDWLDTAPGQWCQQHGQGEMVMHTQWSAQHHQHRVLIQVSMSGPDATFFKLSWPDQGRRQC